MSSQPLLVPISIPASASRQALAAPVANTPSLRICIPTSISLSIPFFSRSSSSTTTTSDTYTSYTGTSFGDGDETETDQEGISPPIPYTPLKSTSSSGRDVVQGRGEGGHGHGTYLKTGGERPGLRKMPSWTSWTSSRSDTGLNDVSDINDDEVEEGEATRNDKSKLHLDIGTWGRMPKVIFNNDHIHTKRYSSPKVKDIETFSPRLVSSHDDIDIDNDRMRRGSDWPPTIARTMKLDLSGIPTFAEEMISSVSASSGVHVDRDIASTGNSGQDAGLVSGTGSRGVIASCQSRVDTPIGMPVVHRLDLKSHVSKLERTLDEADEEMDSEHMSESTTSTQQRKSTPDDKINASVLVLEDGRRPPTIDRVAADPEPEAEEEFFTPVPVPASLFLSHPALPSRSPLGTAPTTSCTDNHPTFEQRDRSQSHLIDDTLSPIFDLSIFSPRPAIPRAPVLRGIGLLDQMTEIETPISPLELPSCCTRPRTEAISMPMPTPILPRNAPCSPTDTGTDTDNISHRSEFPRNVFPSFYDKQPGLTRYGSLRGMGMGPKRSWASISSVLTPSDSSIQTDEMKRPLARASTTTTSRRQSSGLPSLMNGGCGRGPNRSNSISGLPPSGGGSRRRMSLILRPEILPCPTPPSLLTSPKTLGMEYLTLFSPTSNCTSPIGSRFRSLGTASASGGGPGSGGLPSRRGRGSMRLSLGNVLSPLPNAVIETQVDEGASRGAKAKDGSIVDGAGAGVGAGLGLDFVDTVEVEEEHVATPGTFGLEGEAERLVSAGLNPYFA
ncbi:hypothetical protein CI109_105856 [Kwoniella shandongensis]|uniref:Uncharacterized protein n=1 Tax=Kwoniella shandongensis TaxID=1734106 RepID=A0A5M6BVG4_9TREE|nr:uncharacterized protein CI109_005709 [Kwoniella shandongensis]KAA5525962.1 hypothetical protein CI109_005709 [Kwoniella shandongensis]